MNYHSPFFLTSDSIWKQEEGRRSKRLCAFGWRNQLPGCDGLLEAFLELQVQEEWSTLRGGVLCILMGDICWWSGPYAPGMWTDLLIFWESLVSMLEPGERCEMDRGYQGSAPTYVKCPGVLEADPNTVEIQQRVWSRQETVNEHFKNWAILLTPYCHDLLEHQIVFGAIVVLTQNSFAANPLFTVAY